jgi:hypothetical protein
MLRSQRALYESNLFRRAAIEPRPPIDIATPDSAKVVVVTVQEAPPREARLSAGFNTVDFFQVEGASPTTTSWAARGGSTFRQRSEICSPARSTDAASSATLRSRRPAALARYFVPTYNASIDLRQPWFGSPHNELALSLFTHRRSAPGIYVDRGYGTSLTFTRDVAERAPASANYRFEISKVDAGDVYFCINYGVCDQPTLEALRGNQKLSPFTITSTIDRTNDPFSPNRATAPTERRARVHVHALRFPLQSRDRRRSAFIRSGAAVSSARTAVGWVRSLGSTDQALGVAGVARRRSAAPEKAFLRGRVAFGARLRRESAGSPRSHRSDRRAADARQPNVACTSGTDVTACNPNAGTSRIAISSPAAGRKLRARGQRRGPFPGLAGPDGRGLRGRRNGDPEDQSDLPRRRAAITPGFGFRYRSPVGPIRADIGFNPGTTESLPVVTENIVNGQKTLVTLQQRRSLRPAGRWHPQADGPSPVDRRSVLMRRWWVRLIAALVVVVLLLVGAAFLLTNSDWGRERVRRYVEGLIQRNSHGLVHIGSVTGNLLNGFTLHDVVITDSARAPFVKADEIWARYSLGTLRGKKIDLRSEAGASRSS